MTLQINNFTFIQQNQTNLNLINTLFVQIIKLSYKIHFLFSWKAQCQIFYHHCTHCTGRDEWQWITSTQLTRHRYPFDFTRSKPQVTKLVVCLPLHHDNPPPTLSLYLSLVFIIYLCLSSLGAERLDGKRGAHLICKCRLLSILI